MTPVPDNKIISHEQGASSFIAAAFDSTLEGRLYYESNKSESELMIE